MATLTNESFCALITQYERLVYTVCYQLTRNAATAEDLTQETFLSAYVHKDSCPAGFERQWLSRIAANKAKDHLKSAYTRHTLLPGEEELPPIVSQALSPEERLVDQEARFGLQQLIYALREPYRSVCVLCWLKEYTTEQAAIQTGRPIKTIHTQLARAKGMLQEQLRKEAAK